MLHQPARDSICEPETILDSIDSLAHDQTQEKAMLEPYGNPAGRSTDSETISEQETQMERYWTPISLYLPLKEQMLPTLKKSPYNEWFQFLETVKQSCQSDDSDAIFANQIDHLSGCRKDPNATVT